MARSALISGAALLLVACGNHATPAGAGATALASGHAAQEPSATSTADSPSLGPSSNPLGLPPAKVNLDAGKRVFTFSAQMMVAARPGATLVLSPATVAGIEGDDLLI